MEKVDCIVVGAGPAGAACALRLAEKGIRVVLIERGRTPGDKNVASFVLFTEVLESLVPDFREEAPLERRITDHAILTLQKDNYLQFQARYDGHLNNPLGYSAFRGKFDAWFAGKAVEAGAELITGKRVTDLIQEDGRVIGIRVDDDELLADVVVGADGVHSVVARKAGLVVDEPDRYMLGIKEVLDLPEEVIEERFQLKKGEGAIKDGFGYPVEDVGGVFSLYTNRNSLGLAIFGPISALRDQQVNLEERLEQMKEHAYIRELIKGAELRQYLAHVLADGGRVRPGKLYTSGLLLCGEAGGFNSGFWIGVPPAMLSGAVAAETVALAKEKGDFSEKTLKRYVSLLDRTDLLRMLREARRVSNYMVKKGRRKLPVYNRSLADAFEGVLTNEVTFSKKKTLPLLGVLSRLAGRSLVPRIFKAGGRRRASP